jgi:hypothetical protein
MRNLLTDSVNFDAVEQTYGQHTNSSKWQSVGLQSSVVINVANVENSQCTSSIRADRRVFSC